jgi:hypothetical protein
VLTPAASAIWLIVTAMGRWVCRASASNKSAFPVPPARM